MKPNRCYTQKGKLKRSFATEQEAAKAAAEHEGYQAYQCGAHGWHIGCTISRELRKALSKAKRYPLKDREFRQRRIAEEV